MKIVPLDIDNPASFGNVKKALEDLKRKIQTSMVQELLEYVYELFLDFANSVVMQAEIGEGVKDDIVSSWSYTITNGTLMITNSSLKAAYVEFGVGITAEQHPHKDAESAGYEYNVDSVHKQPDRSWYFRYKRGEEYDKNIPDEDLIGGELHTFGTEGWMFCFMAVQYLKSDLQNPNGMIATKWKDIVGRTVF